ncbi:MAG: serine/threonine-protein kinase, partial [Myxococcota bacterium]|nr:serine/threonine-protein kinase [Myxococcota bacterium]
LKVLNPGVEGIDEIAARLRDEARILGLVQHRAVVRVDGLVKLDDRWSVVMEYVHGSDLQRIIAKGQVPVGPALEIVGEVASALHVAYVTEGAGGPLRLLHRDIKPANIQLTANGEVRVLDFGGARAEFGSREANTEVLRLGSMGYMSPERLDFIEGVEGDAYSLGVVLYELVTGSAVGRTSSNKERHEARLDELLEGARSKLGPEYGEVVDFIGELMNFDPTVRPSHRDSERRCHELLRSVNGPRLRDWAEGVVPVLQEEARDCELGDLSGMTLFEQTGEVPRDSVSGMTPKKESVDSDTWAWSVPETGIGAPGPSEEEEAALKASPEEWRPPGDPVAGRSAPIEPAVPQVDGQRSGPPWLVVAGLGVALMVGGYFGMQSTSQDPVVAPTPEVKEVTHEAVDAAPTPDPADHAAVSGDEETPAVPVDPPAPEADAPSSKSPMGTSARKETRASSPSPVVPASPTPPPASAPPAREAAPSGGGTITFTGDASAVWLVSGGRRFEPGNVPAGTYQIEVRFGDGEPIGAGNVHVMDGVRQTYNCSSMFTRCSPVQ